MIGVNAVIIEDGKILAVKRKNEPYAGMFSLPGGNIKEKEDSITALRREVREETGYEVQISESDYLGKGAFSYDSQTFEVECYKAKIIGGAEYPQKEEVEKIEWMGIDDFVRNLEEHGFPKESIDTFLGFLQ